MNKNRSLILFPLVLAGILLLSGCARNAPMDPIDLESSQQKVVSPSPETIVKTEQTDVVEQVLQDSRLQEEALSQGDLESVHFDYDQYTLSSEARSTLNDNAKLLLKQPEVRILVEGHCDARGSDEYNLALGDLRAQAVRNFLLTRGVSEDRMETNSYGEEMPLDPANNEVAWAKNRRAEFKLLN